MYIDPERSPFRVRHHQVDVCVVGGGMAGICAAVAAARHGATVALMQDRPVLGGNASSEIGVRVVGADRGGHIPYARETGILEELRLNNLLRNPQASHSMWDLVLYDTVRYTPGLTLLLNCSCMDAAMDGKRIASVTGWQLSSQTWHTVQARIFADCSGDAVLAPLTGAEWRMGREAAAEFDESIAPPVSDARTMGHTHCLYTREQDVETPFVPFNWARRITDCNALPWGPDRHAHWAVSPWWCELGGEYHTIHDSELLRDELIKVQMGFWDHIKNHCVHRDAAKHWAIERLQFVPGRRESRRYVGAHMLNQREIQSGGVFPDTVCHGGWSLDDHHPAGIDSFAKYGQPPTIHHEAPSPFGIPYRSLYSRNIENLMFAGRVAGCTHVALSATRVMGTCSVMGQAAGTAAALACRHNLMPHGVLDRIGELQQLLLADDVFIPGVAQDPGDLTRSARLDASQGDPEALRDGINRPVSSDPFVWMRKPAFARPDESDWAAFTPHGWEAAPGDHATYRFDHPVHVSQVTLIFDSNMEREITLGAPGHRRPFPENMTREFRIEAHRNGDWEPVAVVDQNIQRHVTLALDETTTGIRLVLGATHGGERSRLYGFLVNASPAAGKECECVGR